MISSYKLIFEFRFKFSKRKDFKFRGKRNPDFSALKLNRPLTTLSSKFGKVKTFLSLGSCLSTMDRGETAFPRGSWQLLSELVIALSRCKRINMRLNIHA